MSEIIYLDHAAATPMSPAVRAAMEPYFSDRFYNPSATYLPARAVRDELDQARQTIAECLGARPAEIVFTAGGTEANNLAIHGVLQAFPAGNLVVSAIEHDSVLEPAKAAGAKIVPVDEAGIVGVEQLLGLVDDDTVLVSVMYANNEVGTVQPIRDVARHLAEVRRQRREAGNKLPLYLHTDAAQAANYLDLHVARLGVDLMTINGGKIYGPKQSGLLYVKAGTQLTPQLLGGGQERMLRSGTENVAADVGLAAALAQTTAMRLEETARLQQLQRLFVAELTKALPQAILNGSLKHRLPNNVHVTIPGSDNERLLIELEQTGVLAAAGSACSASNEEPSHVLAAMGRNDEAAQASLRFTMGRMTSETDVRTVVATLTALFA